MTHNTLKGLIVLFAVAAFIGPVQAQSLPAAPATPQASAPDAELPEDPMRELTLRACSTCHAVDMITKQRLSQQGWYDMVQMMGDRGALATSSELEQIAAYLYRAFPDE